MSSQYFDSKWILGAIVILEVAAWVTLKALGWDTMIALVLSAFLMAVCCAVGVLLSMGLWRWSSNGFRFRTSHLLVLMALLCVVIAGLAKLYVRPYLQRRVVEELRRSGVQFYDQENRLISPDRSVGDDATTTLVLSNDDVVRSTATYLWRFSKLDSVILGGNVTDASLESLASARIGHDVALTLWGHKLTDDCLKHLCDLTFVRSICINGPAITHRGLVSLADSKYLENVMLMEEGATTLTRVNDALIGPISRMENLRSLVVAGPGITDASIDVFAQLPNLEKLDLRGTRISSDGRIRLRSVLKGCRVNVD